MQLKIILKVTKITFAVFKILSQKFPRSRVSPSPESITRRVKMKQVVEGYGGSCSNGRKFNMAEEKCSRTNAVSMS